MGDEVNCCNNARTGMWIIELVRSFHDLLMCIFPDRDVNGCIAKISADPILTSVIICMVVAIDGAVARLDVSASRVITSSVPESQQDVLFTVDLFMIMKTWITRQSAQSRGLDHLNGTSSGHSDSMRSSFGPPSARLRRSSCPEIVIATRSIWTEVHRPGQDQETKIFSQHCGRLVDRSSI